MALSIAQNIFLPYDDLVMPYTLLDPKLAKAVKGGAVGVLPTDTIYGLVGSAYLPETVERIYNIRERDQDKAFIVLISSLKDLEYFHITPDAYTKKILHKIWPGKVSVILPCSSDKFRYLHRGLHTLAFRLPSDKKLAEFISRTGPLVAPSANPANLPPAKTISEARKYFGNKVDFYIDGGTLESEPSTLIAIENGGIVVKREGADVERVKTLEIQR